MTVHGAFVLFNVYAPNDGAWHRSLPYKIRFLNALRDAMQRAREKWNLPVMLVGDMNLKVRAMDSTLAHRRISLREIKQWWCQHKGHGGDVTSTDAGDDPNKKYALLVRNFCTRMFDNGEWDVVKTMLGTKKVVEVQMNSQARKNLKRWLLFVKRPHGAKAHANSHNGTASTIDGNYTDLLHYK
jgi:hypothetical protein